MSRYDDLAEEKHLFRIRMTDDMQRVKPDAADLKFHPASYLVIPSDTKCGAHHQWDICPGSRFVATLGPVTSTSKGHRPKAAILSLTRWVKNFGTAGPRSIDNW